MNMKALAQTLQRAAAMLASANAKPQAEAILGVAEVIAQQPDASVEAFVGETRAKLDAPKLHELSAQAVVERIVAARNNRQETLSILAALKSAPLDKSKAIEIATLLAGQRKVHFKSKPQALRDIEERIQERLYLDSKDAMNKGVTPW